jgi:hypothetical protein
LPIANCRLPIANCRLLARIRYGGLEELGFYFANVDAAAGDQSEIGNRKSAIGNRQFP